MEKLGMVAWLAGWMVSEVKKLWHKPINPANQSNHNCLTIQNIELKQYIKFLPVNIKKTNFSDKKESKYYISWPNYFSNKYQK